MAYVTHDDERETMTGRLTMRVSEDMAKLLEELRQLGQNPSDLVRDILETARPGLEMLRDGLEAKKRGVKMNIAEGIGKVILKAMGKK